MQLNKELTPFAFSMIASHIDDGGYTKETERNIEYLFVQLAYGDTSIENLPVYSASWNLNPKSRGNIHIGGPGMSQPIIEYNDKEDLRVVARYILTVLIPYLSFTNSGYVLIPTQYLINEDVLIEYLWNQAFIRGYHYVGQCSMGKVVDSKLKVFGVKNLRIADNSIYPIIPPCHTSVTAQALGFYAVDKILGK